MLSMASEKKCHEMGSCARKRIIAQYSIEKAVQGTIQAVTMLMRNSSL